MQSVFIILMYKHVKYFMQEKWQMIQKIANSLLGENWVNHIVG